MKKIFTRIAVGLVVVGGVLFLFREPLIEGMMGQMTSDMFVSADTDSFDPGVAIGEQFPPLNALYEGQVVSSIGGFVQDKGMIFIANRSADW
jgi:hypothetical protein